MRFAPLALAAVLAVGGTVTQATAAFTTTATARDYYNELGNNQNGIFGPAVNNSYFAGYSSTNQGQTANLPANTTEEYRNYFVFSLAGVSAEVTGGRILAFNPGLIPGDPSVGFGYSSTNLSDTYALYSVDSTAIATLTSAFTGNTAAGQAIFADLGAGTLLGTYTFTQPGDLVNQSVSIELNTAGLAYVNANLGGQIAFGGALTSARNGFEQAVFRGTYNDSPVADGNVVLELEVVPVPPAAMLFAIGGVCLGGFRSVRRRLA